MINLTISIVNYNAGEYLTRCLQSIKNVEKEAKITVYIVDNASSDDSFDQAKLAFPKYNYIKNNENLGFGRAHNLVLSKANADYILVLNPDVELVPGVILTVIKKMEQDQKIGVSTCKIVLPNGKVDLTAHRGFPTPWASLRYFLGDDSLYHLSKLNLNQLHEVDAISGAFFMVRKSVLDQVGYFDEDYFMYAEDIDICYRIKQAGYKVMYIPQVEVMHYKGISSGLKKHSQVLSTATYETKIRSLNAFYSTMKTFYQKHYQKNYPFFINWLIYFAIDLKRLMAKRSLKV